VRKRFVIHQDARRPLVVGPYYNPKNFGAKGDGVSDDGPAWNAMMVAMREAPMHLVEWFAEEVPPAMCGRIVGFMFGGSYVLDVPAFLTGETLAELPNTVTCQACRDAFLNRESMLVIARILSSH
jgi:hypothetical protein